ncbi:MAG: nucleoside triphosphate pyrophosphohydrolase [Rhodospirillales bacterium]|jgi:ATP diphosphatase|nr:nucleoside triphosphate pyrophosphohydrolase [Rhodospirillales bacterium]
MPPSDHPDQLRRLLDIMAHLRNPQGGCLWDIEQTFATIAPHTIEEAYEVADAIEQNDMAALCEELGDLLLQVVYHAQMASEAGLFCFDDVAAAICDKMIERHPHVFGDVEVASSAAQTRQWEAQKAEERRRKASANGDRAPSALDGVIRALPALTRALKIQNRAARVGFDWSAADQVIDKIREEIDEITHEMSCNAPPARLDDEVGDLLFACTNLARKLGIDPEGALRRGTAKFERRFHRVEALLAAAGRSPEMADLGELETLWGRAKSEERGEV